MMVKINRVLVGLIGVLLVFASFLKATDAKVGRAIERTVFIQGSNDFSTVLIEVEFAIGMLLVLCSNSNLVKLLSMVLFSAFTVANIIAISNHKSGCGCFGAIQLNPWHVLYFDVFCIAAIATLWLSDLKFKKPSSLGSPAMGN